MTQTCPHITAGCGIPDGECLGACLSDPAPKPSRRPQLIGLIGPAGSGKDTVRQFLEEDFDYAGTAFAEPMRVMVRALFDHLGISHDYIDLRERKEVVIPELGVSYRHIMQTLGTEWAQQCLGRDFWIRCAALIMNQAESFGYRRVVFSDVRFVPEADWIKERGGQLWRIDRPEVTPVREHVSESVGKLIDCDRTIQNDGSLDLLWLRVNNAVHGE